jgi:hypothetical protein
MDGVWVRSPFWGKGDHKCSGKFWADSSIGSFQGDALFGFGLNEKNRDDALLLRSKTI